MKNSSYIFHSNLSVEECLNRLFQNMVNIKTGLFGQSTYLPKWMSTPEDKNMFGRVNKENNSFILQAPRKYLISLNRYSVFMPAFHGNINADASGKTIITGKFSSTTVVFLIFFIGIMFIIAFSDGVYFDSLSLFAILFSLIVAVIFIAFSQQHKNELLSFLKQTLEIK